MGIESRQSDIFYRDEFVMAFISAGWWPNNQGSVLIAPIQHYENIFDIPANLFEAVNELGRRLAPLIQMEYDCEGISFRQHNLAAGGQSVNHYHLWVFPRFTGDHLYELYSKGAIVQVEERSKYARRLGKHFTGEYRS
jgi:histidine triad (HIT) family protein